MKFYNANEIDTLPSSFLKGTIINPGDFVPYGIWYDELKEESDFIIDFEHLGKMYRAGVGYNLRINEWVLLETPYLIV